MHAFYQDPFFNEMSDWKIEKAVLLTDLNDASYRAVAAPVEYRRW
jgi:hypothetical protein